MGTGHRGTSSQCCAACLRLLQVRAPVLCGTAPPLLSCVRFATADTPTRAIWPAYELHHLLCTAVFRVEPVGQRHATAAHPLCQSRLVETGTQHVLCVARVEAFWGFFLCENKPSCVHSEPFCGEPFGQQLNREQKTSLSTLNS